VISDDRAAGDAWRRWLSAMRSIDLNIFARLAPGHLDRHLAQERMLIVEGGGSKHLKAGMTASQAADCSVNPALRPSDDRHRHLAGLPAGGGPFSGPRSQPS